jgi:glycosyltransferase involved in cell wall biosynthesis
MHVCIVSTKHVSYNPRVVKEADALSAAGHEVTVVTVCNNREQALLDEGVMTSRNWRLLTVRYRIQGVTERLRWLHLAVRQKVHAKCLSRLTLGLGVAERAQGREHPELKSLACSVRADLYIAHHPEALGAAHAAARKCQARFAFDAEDCHSEMFGRPVMPTQASDQADMVRQLLAGTAAGPRNPEQRRIEYLERKYLPRCDYLTAASDGIAEAYACKYGLDRPTTILNVFPLAPLAALAMSEREARASRRADPAPGCSVRLYWYSQVIGPGRGLEEAVQALALLPVPAELHLRGSAQPGFVETLVKMAAGLGVGDRLHLHPPCPPDELIAEAASFDIGLALETGKEINNLLASSNKLFTYMNAGLAIIATDTPGQRSILGQAPAAGVMCRMNDAASLAEAIIRLLETPQVMRRAQQASRAAAETHFNWEVESKKLLELVCDVS